MSLSFDINAELVLIEHGEKLRNGKAVEALLALKDTNARLKRLAEIWPTIESCIDPLEFVSRGYEIAETRRLLKLDGRA